jgi:hypothetical protein
MYFAAICLQCEHLTISVLLQLGHLNTVVPSEFVTFFLHDEHASFFSVIDFRIGVLFINLIISV